jgi:hypothetical protein
MSAVTPCKNRKQLALAAGLIVLTALAAQALPFRRVSTDGEDVLITEPQARPRIEVAFVLDTTGSMSGLIEGAKRKIWTMMNQLADSSPPTSTPSTRRSRASRPWGVATPPSLSTRLSTKP